MEQPVLSEQPGIETMDLNVGLLMDEINVNEYSLHTEVDIKLEPMDDEDSYEDTGGLLDDHHIELEHQHVKTEVESGDITARRKSEASNSQENGNEENYEKKNDVNSTESKNNCGAINNSKSTKTSDFIPSKIIISSKKSKNTDSDQNINKQKHEDKVQNNIYKRSKVTIGTKKSSELCLSKKKSIKKNKKERKAYKEIDISKNYSQNKDVYKCDICFRQFTFKSNLSKHTEVFHKNIATHACNHCDKKFGRKDYLDRHKLGVHNIGIGKNIIKCICGKEFADRSNYTRHVRKYCLQYEREKTSEQDLKFSCDICQKKYYNKSYMLQHRILHDDSKLPTCDYCQATE